MGQRTVPAALVPLHPLDDQHTTSFGTTSVDDSQVLLADPPVLARESSSRDSRPKGLRSGQPAEMTSTSRGATGFDLTAARASVAEAVANESVSLVYSS